MGKIGKIFEEGIGALFEMEGREQERKHEIQVAEASRPIINLQKVVVIDKETGKKLTFDEDKFDFVDVEGKVVE